MSVFHKAIKQILKDMDKFLTSTLRGQNLSKEAKIERLSLIDAIQKLYEDFDILNNKGEKEKLKPKTPSLTSSVGSQRSEDDGSTDNKIPQCRQADLKDSIIRGYLLHRKTSDSKQKLFKQKKDQKKYCVIHRNIMYWFLNPSDKNYDGAISLTGFELKDLTRNKDFVFELASHNTNACYQFQADNKEDLDEWKTAVETGIKFVDETGEVYETCQLADANDYEDDNEYFEAITPIPTKQTKGSETKTPTRNELGSSIPRLPPPRPPSAATESVPLPLPKKGKDPKPQKTNKIKQMISAMEKPKNSPPTSTSQPSVENSSINVGNKIENGGYNNSEGDNEMYETVDPSSDFMKKVASVDVRRLSMPIAPPPEPPQTSSDKTEMGYKNVNVYMNDKPNDDSDNLVYE